MFERYTEKARRVIFFARYEASQLGSSAIEPEHILLGLLREDKPLVLRLFASSHSAVESIRKEIEKGIEPGVRLAASVDMPLSPNAKRVLEIAADESQKLNHHYIGTNHLLIGIIKEEKSVASQILADLGISVDQAIALIEENITSPEPADLEPTLLQLFEQSNALIELLIRRGIFTRQEFVDELAGRSGPPRLQESLYALVDLLVKKGVIEEGDRQKIMDSGQ